MLSMIPIVGPPLVIFIMGGWTLVRTICTATGNPVVIQLAQIASVWIYVGLF
jgi:hypothetical protein